MRRLRKDWNSHGWKQDPTYDYDWSGGKVTCVLAERTTLCDCFDLTHREALRFKDTPNTSSFRRRDFDKYRNGRATSVPIQERRAVPDDRERHGSRKRRRGVVGRAKLSCSCGYLLEVMDVVSGVHVSRRKYNACPDCRRRSAVAGELYRP
jgi:hypothetical protein